MEKINEKLFKQIAEEVESSWNISGMSDGIYYDYALEITKEYMRKISKPKYYRTLTEAFEAAGMGKSEI